MPVIGFSSAAPAMLPGPGTAAVSQTQTEDALVAEIAQSVVDSTFSARLCTAIEHANRQWTPSAGSAAAAAAASGSGGVSFGRAVLSKLAHLSSAERRAAAAIASATAAAGSAASGGAGPGGGGGGSVPPSPHLQLKDQNLAALGAVGRRRSALPPGVSDGEAGGGAAGGASSALQQSLDFSQLRDDQLCVFVRYLGHFVSVFGVEALAHWNGVLVTCLEHASIALTGEVAVLCRAVLASPAVAKSSLPDILMARYVQPHPAPPPSVSGLLLGYAVAHPRAFFTKTETFLSYHDTRVQGAALELLRLALEQLTLDPTAGAGSSAAAAGGGGESSIPLLVDTPLWQSLLQYLNAVPVASLFHSAALCVALAVQPIATHSHTALNFERDEHSAGTGCGATFAVFGRSAMWLHDLLHPPQPPPPDIAAAAASLVPNAAALAQRGGTASASPAITRSPHKNPRLGGGSGSGSRSGRSGERRSSLSLSRPNLNVTTAALSTMSAAQLALALGSRRSSNTVLHQSVAAAAAAASASGSTHSATGAVAGGATTSASTANSAAGGSPSGAAAATLVVTAASPLKAVRTLGAAGGAPLHPGTKASSGSTLTQALQPPLLTASSGAHAAHESPHSANSHSRSHSPSPSPVPSPGPTGGPNSTGASPAAHTAELRRKHRAASAASADERLERDRSQPMAAPPPPNSGLSTATSGNSGSGASGAPSSGGGGGGAGSAAPHSGSSTTPGVGSPLSAPALELTAGTSGAPPAASPMSHGFAGPPLNRTPSPGTTASGSGVAPPTSGDASAPHSPLPSRAPLTFAGVPVSTPPASNLVSPARPDFASPRGFGGGASAAHSAFVTPLASPMRPEAHITSTGHLTEQHIRSALDTPLVPAAATGSVSNSATGSTGGGASQARMVMPSAIAPVMLDTKEPVSLSPGTLARRAADARLLRRSAGRLFQVLYRTLPFQFLSYLHAQCTGMAVTSPAAGPSDSPAIAAHAFVFRQAVAQFVRSARLHPAIVFQARPPSVTSPTHGFGASPGGAMAGADAAARPPERRITTRRRSRSSADTSPPSALRGTEHTHAPAAATTASGTTTANSTPRGAARAPEFPTAAQRLAVQPPAVPMAASALSLWDDLFGDSPLAPSPAPERERQREPSGGGGNSAAGGYGAADISKSGSPDPDLSVSFVSTVSPIAGSAVASVTASTASLAESTAPTPVPTSATPTVGATAVGVAGIPPAHPHAGVSAFSTPLYAPSVASGASSTLVLPHSGLATPLSPFALAQGAPNNSQHLLLSPLSAAANPDLDSAGGNSGGVWRRDRDRHCSTDLSDSAVFPAAASQPASAKTTPAATLTAPLAPAVMPSVVTGDAEADAWLRAELQFERAQFTLELQRMRQQIRAMQLQAAAAHHHHHNHISPVPSTALSHAPHAASATSSSRGGTFGGGSHVVSPSHSRHGSGSLASMSAVVYNAPPLALDSPAGPAIGAVTVVNASAVNSNHQALVSTITLVNEEVTRMAGLMDKQKARHRSELVKKQKYESDLMAKFTKLKSERAELTTALVLAAEQLRATELRFTTATAELRAARDTNVELSRRCDVLTKQNASIAPLERALAVANAQLQRTELAHHLFVSHTLNTTVKMGADKLDAAHRASAGARDTIAQLQTRLQQSEQQLAVLSRRLDGETQVSQQLRALNEQTQAKYGAKFMALEERCAALKRQNTELQLLVTAAQRGAALAAANISPNPTPDRSSPHSSKGAPTRSGPPSRSGSGHVTAEQMSRSGIAASLQAQAHAHAQSQAQAKTGAGGRPFSTAPATLISANPATASAAASTASVPAAVPLGVHHAHTSPHNPNAAAGPAVVTSVSSAHRGTTSPSGPNGASGSGAAPPNSAKPGVLSRFWGLITPNTAGGSTSGGGGGNPTPPRPNGP